MITGPGQRSHDGHLQILARLIESLKFGLAVFAGKKPFLLLEGRGILVRHSQLLTQHDQRISGVFPRIVKHVRHEILRQIWLRRRRINQGRLPLLLHRHQRQLGLKLLVFPHDHDRFPQLLRNIRNVVRKLALRVIPKDKVIIVRKQFLNTRHDLLGV